MPTFVGRERELELAVDALGRTGRVVLLHGPGGIGKTRLLREALDRVVAADRRARVLVGRANQLDADLAYAPLVDALTSHLDGLTPADQHELLQDLDVLADLLDGYGLTAPAVPSGRDGERLHRTRRLDAIRRVLDRIAGAPVILVLDDAHWADEGTLAALAHVARSLEGSALTVALTFRDDEASPALRVALATLRRAGPAVDLALAPLTEASVATILAAELGAAPSPSLRRLVVDRAGGNSLYVTALARHLRDAGLVRPWLDDVVDLVPGAEVGVPAEVEDMLALRLDAVSPTARDVLGAVGVADGPVVLDVLTAVTGHPHAGVEAAVDELVAAGLAVERARTGHVAAAHPLVGETAYRALGYRRRCHLHGAFVTAIEADPTAGPPGRLPRHYRLAGSTVDPGRAIDVLVEAADRALVRFTPREALLHSQAAVDLARHSGARPVAPLLRRLGVAWGNLGESDTGEAILRSALDVVDRDADPRLATAVLADLATQLYYRGLPDEALTCLREATDLDPVGAEVALVPWRRAHIAFTFGLAEELQTVASALGDRRSGHAHPDEQVLTPLVQALAAQDRGDFTAAVAQAERVITALAAVGEDIGPFGAAIRARTVLVQVAAYRGDTDEVARHLPTIERLVQLVHSPHAGWRAAAARMQLGHLRGEDQDVADERALLQRLAESDPSRLRLHRWFDVIEAWSGDVERLRERLEDHTGGLTDDPNWWRTRTDLMAIAIARAGSAADVAAIDLDVPPQTHSLMPPLNLAARALLALRQGRHDVDRLVGQLRAMGAASTVPAVLADLVDLHRVDDEQVPALAGDALDRCAAGGWRRLEAWVARCAAVRIAAHDPAGAVDLAARAVDLASQLGERVDVDAATAVLRAAGVHRRVPRDGEGPLTGRQREIADLVADGLSNADIATRLFISVRTVTTHLDHVYQRLDISSRHELAALVRDGRLTSTRPSNTPPLNT